MASRKNIADELVTSMREALAHARGKTTRARTTKYRVKPVDAKTPHGKLARSQ
jgi:hypothetical protein